jgi:hypothetical protein
MRSFQIPLTLAAMFLGAMLLCACSSQPGIERVDVEWVTDPPPRWGLYPGYRQEIPFRRGSAYRVHVYVNGKELTGGTVGDTGYSLAFLSTAGARDIDAEALGRDGLRLFVTLKNEKGESRRLPCLTVERKEDKIFFEMPKP